MIRLLMASQEPLSRSDRFDLTRFIDAQAAVFDEVIQELRHGQKRTHWMWFIFPQLRGLGRSPTAQFYGLESADEAKAYILDPLLGVRLKQTTLLVLDIPQRTAHDIFGSPDDLKFQSCMTLFEFVAPDASCFGLALETYFAGIRDSQTLRMLHDENRSRDDSPGIPPQTT